MQKRFLLLEVLPIFSELKENMEREGRRERVEKWKMEQSLRSQRRKAQEEERERKHQEWLQKFTERQNISEKLKGRLQRELEELREKREAQEAQKLNESQEEKEQRKVQDHPLQETHHTKLEERQSLMEVPLNQEAYHTTAGGGTEGIMESRLAQEAQEQRQSAMEPQVTGPERREGRGGRWRSRTTPPGPRRSSTTTTAAPGLGPRRSRTAPRHQAAQEEAQVLLFSWGGGFESNPREMEEEGAGEGSEEEEGVRGGSEKEEEEGRKAQVQGEEGLGAQGQAVKRKRKLKGKKGWKPRPKSQEGPAAPAGHQASPRSSWSSQHGQAKEPQPSQEPGPTTAAGGGATSLGPTTAPALGTGRRGPASPALGPRSSWTWRVPSSSTARRGRLASGEVESSKGHGPNPKSQESQQSPGGEQSRAHQSHGRAQQSPGEAGVGETAQRKAVPQ